MAINLKQLEAGKLRAIEKRINSLDDTVWIRQLSVAQIDELQAIEDDHVRAMETMRLCLTDETGVTLTTEAVEAVNSQNNNNVLGEIGAAIIDVNWLRGDPSGES